MAAQAAEQTATFALSAALAALREALTAIPLPAYAAQTPAEARRTAARLRELRSIVEIHVGVAVRAVERLVPTRDTRQLLAGDFGLDTGAAHRDVRDARAAASSALAEAAAAGGVISHTHAVVIGRALRDLPSTATDPQRELAERALIDDATRLAPRDLQTRARRITELFAPEDEVDQTEDALLSRRERFAYQRASLTMWDNRDGTWAGRFVLPELQARMLKTVIDAHAAPRRSHLSNASNPGSGLARDGGDKPYDRKAGDALISVIEHLPIDRLPGTGGTPARIIVTIPEAKLRSATAAATLSTGERVSSGELRRLACSQGILPAVLGGASVPVDLGRAQRLFSPYQRDALASLDGGCVAPGCDRPPAWCETHHGGDPWSRGGRTDVKDGYLLCCTHHHEAHRQRWKFRRRPDGRAEADRGRGWEPNDQRYRPRLS